MRIVMGNYEHRKVSTLRAWIDQDSCVKCQAQLERECQRFGLPEPTGNPITVPKRWYFEECTHEADGLVLKFEHYAVKEMEELSLRDDANETGEWGDRLDSSKDIGYPRGSMSRTPHMTGLMTNRNRRWL